MKRLKILAWVAGLALALTPALAPAQEATASRSAGHSRAPTIQLVMCPTAPPVDVTGARNCRRDNPANAGYLDLRLCQMTTPARIQASPRAPQPHDTNLLAREVGASIARA